MLPHQREITAHLDRAQTSLRAARDLWAAGYYDFATSRAYYAAFYAATAALLSENLTARKHSGLIALVHQRLVKTGRLAEEQGKALNWLFELRAIADYGVTTHISGPEAAQALQAAESFVQAIHTLLRQDAEPSSES